MLFTRMKEEMNPVSFANKRNESRKSYNDNMGAAQESQSNTHSQVASGKKGKVWIVQLPNR